MADATLKMVLLGQDRGASRAIKNVGDAAGRTETRTDRLGAAFAKAGKFAAVGLAAGVVRWCWRAVQDDARCAV